jgi:hypothetical protein
MALFADGYQPATEPGNPNIAYASWQSGNVARIDRSTGEIVYLTPQPEPGDAPERFNWDAPILISPFSPTRLYYASQRVWRSDDRGDSWKPISGDLTRNVDRLTLPMMGHRWGWDAPWDMYAMSEYSTITSLAESPQREGLLWAGTDDGLLQLSEDGGAHWRAIDVGSIPGVPASSFVNDVKADLFDADTVYVALDNHKSGDFKPYLVASHDRGKSWQSIAGDLPDRHLVWRVVQDEVQPKLMFAATEFGIYFTVDGGTKWVQLSGGAPTIAFRDLAIQRREHDLVGASFGRGFFVLDDYTPLRQVTAASLDSQALLFAPRKALWYFERRPLGGDGADDNGASYYVAPNPPYGAVVTYYLAEGLQTIQQKRQKAEKPLVDAAKDVPLPTWEELEAERREVAPMMVLTVRDASGQVVRKLTAPASKGFHRVAWDLRYPARDPLSQPPGPNARFTGALAAPGHYTVSLGRLVDGVETEVAAPVGFDVERLRQGALPGATPEQVSEFAREVERINGEAEAASQALDHAAERVDLLGAVLERSTAPAELEAERTAIRADLYALDEAFNGNKSKGELSAAEAPTIQSRIQVAAFAGQFSTYGPTPTQRRSLAIGIDELAAFKKKLAEIVDVRIPALEKKLDAAGVPWTPGRPLP